MIEWNYSSQWNKIILAFLPIFLPFYFQISDIACSNSEIHLHRLRRCLCHKIPTFPALFGMPDVSYLSVSVCIHRILLRLYVQPSVIASFSLSARYSVKTTRIY